MLSIIALSISCNESEKWSFIFSTSIFSKTFSYIFEKMFITLAGRSLDTEYLFSVCLSKGEAHATFALSRNFPFNMLLLNALDNGVLKKSADN